MDPGDLNLYSVSSLQNIISLHTPYFITTIPVQRTRRERGVHARPFTWPCLKNPDREEPEGDPSASERSVHLKTFACFLGDKGVGGDICPRLELVIYVYFKDQRLPTLQRSPDGFSPTLLRIDPAANLVVIVVAVVVSDGYTGAKMNDLRPLSYAVISVLWVIATATIGMRIYVRGFAMRAFGLDDWAMTAMMVFNACQQGILYFFLEFGGGLHITYIETEHPEWLPVLLKGLLAEEFWYIWMQFSIKMCFLLFYFRLSKTRIFRRSLWGVICFHVTTTLVIWLLYGLQCKPLAAFYDPAAYPETKCLSTDITYFVPYSLNMTTDLLIFVLPLPVIWSLQMTLIRRLAVVAVLTTGGSAVLTSGLRAIILWEFATSPDFTWSLGKMVIISNVEMQVAIVAANMPALKAFYSCWQQNKLGPGKGTGIENSSTGGGQRTKGSQSEVEMNTGLASSRSRNRGKTPDPMTLAMTESEEKLFENGRQPKNGGFYEGSMQSA